MTQNILQQDAPLTNRAHQILDTAKRLATREEEIEITLASLTAEYLRFGINELSQSQYSTGHVLSVRVASGKKQARVTTGRLEPSSIQNTVQKALNQARKAPEDPDYLPMLGRQKYPKVNRFHEKTWKASADSKAGRVGFAIDLAKKNGLLASGVLGTDANQMVMVNSSGLEAYYEETAGVFSLTMDADNGNQSGFALSTFTDIDELDHEAVAKTSLERARLNKGQTEVTPGKYDVVIDPYAWSEMIFFLTISASAGYTPDFGTRQYKEGRSYLSGRLGEKIMGDNISIEDDPYHPLQTGAPFDGEGYAKSKVTLVEDGVMRGLASSRISAHKYSDAKPTGQELPLPNPLGETPTNVVIRGRGGTRTVKELVEEMDKGLLITRLWYVREVEPRTKTVTGMTRDGTFLVENGEIKKPVRNLRFNQSLLELFSNVEGFTDPVRNTSLFRGATLLQPGILARDFNFTSVSPF